MNPRDFDTPAPFADLRREFDRLLDGFMGNVNRGMPFRSRAHPAVNVWEDHEALHVEAEAPGLSMRHVDVQVIGRELTIKGEAREAPGEGVTFHRQERDTGEFARYLTLPCEVNADKVEAVLKDGLLSITLPKSDIAKTRKIEVKGE